MKEHWFWWLVTCAVLVWYSSVTIYIGVRGTLDIRHMLRRLSERPAGNDSKSGPDSRG